jgi:hypothetical protein
MSQDRTPQISVLPRGGFISTIFTYQSVNIQNAANSVYIQKSTIDGQNAAAGSFKVQTFKTDRERMQYLIGRQGTVPGCSGY